ncbi:MAG: hypothetical protein ACRELY_11780, partial [Polyangiaceae bacterium]
MRNVWMIGAIVAAGFLASMAACGSDDTSTFSTDGGAPGDAIDEHDPFLDGLTSMDIAPPNAVVEATPAKAGTQVYTVTGHFAGAPDKDITSHVLFGVGNTKVGFMSGSTFTSTTTQGGQTTVEASAGTSTASTNVTVHFTATTNGPDNGTPLPADPSHSFT